MHLDWRNLALCGPRKYISDFQILKPQRLFSEAIYAI